MKLSTPTTRVGGQLQFARQGVRFVIVTTRTTIIVTTKTTSSRTFSIIIPVGKVNLRFVAMRQDIFLRKQTDFSQASNHQFSQGLLDALLASIFVADTE